MLEIRSLIHVSLNNCSTKLAWCRLENLLNEVNFRKHVRQQKFRDDISVSVDRILTGLEGNYPR